MQGTSFFRAGKDKCPKCGHFGEEADDGHQVCPSCSARYNEFVILQDGHDVEHKNN